MSEERFLDCGDSSCIFAFKKGGMRTNGGCRCLGRGEFKMPSELRWALQKWAHEAKRRIKAAEDALAAKG